MGKKKNPYSFLQNSDQIKKSKETTGNITRINQSRRERGEKGVREKEKESKEERRE